MSLNTTQKSAHFHDVNTNPLNGLLRNSMPLTVTQRTNCGSTSSLSSCSQLSQSNRPSDRNEWPNFSLTQKDIFAFKRLLDEPIVEELLNWDKCCLLADKYLLATALTYFKRANLRHQQYTPCYLFVALYLAHDMEEDDLDLKNDLVRFAMCDSVSNSKLKLFLRKRDKLWHAMGFRSAVNHFCCDAIIKYCLPNHKIWRRERATNHGGVCLPMHVKNFVHKELRLVNSYVECNIRCIVCESRNYLNFQKCLNNSVAKQPIISELSADSEPFIPQNSLQLPVQQYFRSEISEE